MSTLDLTKAHFYNIAIQSINSMEKALVLISNSEENASILIDILKSNTWQANFHISDNSDFVIELVFPKENLLLTLKTPKNRINYPELKSLENGSAKYLCVGYSVDKIHLFLNKNDRLPLLRDYPN